ncbi:MAG: hypothetical protein QW734_06495 [Candidatus Bathyarchaeia archaeon]
MENMEEKLREIEEKFFNEILRLQKQIDEIKDKIKESEMLGK